MPRSIQIWSTIAVVSALSQLATADEVHWPGLLGPQRDGQVNYFQLPDAWPQQARRMWRVQVGVGYSSPLVVDGLVYQYARQGDHEVMWCFDLANGQQVWRNSYPVPFTMGGGGEWHGKGPKSAPALADGRIFTMSISGILSAWNAKSGDLIWQRDYAKRFERGKVKSTPYWGATTSPIVDGQRVIVHFGNDDSGVLVALDVDTGEEAWTLDKDAPSYSSPLLATLQGVRQVVEWNHRAVVGIDSESGRQLWEFPFPHQDTNQNMPTPSIHNGRIFVGGENRGIRSIQPVLAGSDWTAIENWHQQEVALDMSTAIVNGQRLYGLSHYGAGRLFCLDTKTGEVLWLGPRRTGQHASLLALPGYVLALIDDGELQVIRATGEKYEQVAAYRLAESPTWAPPVLLTDGILVKDHDSLTSWNLAE